jgi:rhodanese-related sulfurtransferase
MPSCSITACAWAADGGKLVVDIRSPEAYAGAHVPKSFSLPLDMLPTFAGMFLAYDQPLGLIVEDCSQIEEAVRGLTRIGYDQARLMQEETLLRRLFLGHLVHQDDQQDHHQYADYRPKPHPSATPTHPPVLFIIKAPYNRRI